ncbi:uncharacterized protein LOC113790586 [Dermatophagoides pteronyssinus]|uniref:uncharacterized protein LOC113790586 n=1 Tax=Dermatophagoides pteronyssinus TaxID=6956 RepID=UPI003F66CBC1
MAENIQMNNDVVVVVSHADDNDNENNNELETAKAFAKDFIEKQFAQEIAEKMTTFEQETMDLKIRTSTTTNNIDVETSATPICNGNAKPVQNGDDHLSNDNVPSVTVTMVEEIKSTSDSEIENEQSEYVDATDSIQETPATGVTMVETITTEELATDVTMEESVSEEKLSEAPMTNVNGDETVEESPATDFKTEEIVQQYPLTNVTMNESVPEPLTTTNVAIEETVPDSPIMTMEETEPVTSITTVESEHEITSDEPPMTNITGVMGMENGHVEHLESPKTNGAALENKTPTNDTSNVVEPGQTEMHHEHHDNVEMYKNFKKMGINENWWKERRSANEKEQEESKVPVDKFRTIKQNIRRGNTRSLKERFENMSKLTE